MAPFGGEGPLTLISDLEAGGLVSQCPSGGEGMGSKLGWLPVDGASGDFLIQESHPLQGCVRSYAIIPKFYVKGILLYTAAVVPVRIRKSTWPSPQDPLLRARVYIFGESRLVTSWVDPPPSQWRAGGPASGSSSAESARSRA